MGSLVHFAQERILTKVFSGSLFLHSLKKTKDFDGSNEGLNSAVPPASDYNMLLDDLVAEFPAPPLCAEINLKWPFSVFSSRSMLKYSASNFRSRARKVHLTGFPTFKAPFNFDASLNQTAKNSLNVTGPKVLASKIHTIDFERSVPKYRVGGGSATGRKV